MPATINPGADDKRPFVSSLFEVTIDGVTLNDVMSVSGLNLDVTDVQVDTVYDGKHAQEYTPGVVSYPELTIKRTFRGDKTLYDWHQKAVTGADTEMRKTGSVFVHNLKGDIVDTWNFQHAWISKWSISDFDVSGDDAVTEEVTIQIEFLERAK